MAEFNFQHQIPYFEGLIDDSFTAQNVIYPYYVNEYHQCLQNFNWERAPQGYYNPCYFSVDSVSRPSRKRRFQQYNMETKGGHRDQIDKPKTYFDKLKAADRKREAEVKPLFDNYISTIISKSKKEINRENGNVGKYADRIRYRKPRKYKENDPMKAYIIDDRLEFIKIPTENIGLVRKRAVDGHFVGICVGGEKDIHEISKVLLETTFEDVLHTDFEGDEVRCYILMNSIDYLTIPSRQLVYERNKMTGGLFIKSKRTMNDIAYLNLDERPVIFLEGYRQTAVTTEDGKVIKQCRLIILDSKQDEDHFYKELQKKKDRHSSEDQNQLLTVTNHGEDNMDVMVERCILPEKYSLTHNNLL